MAASASLLSVCSRTLKLDSCLLHTCDVAVSTVSCHKFSLSLVNKKAPFVCDHSFIKVQRVASGAGPRSGRRFVCRDGMESNSASESNDKAYSQVEIVFGNVTLGGELSQNGAQELSASAPQKAKPIIAAAGDKMVDILTVFNGLLERPFGSAEGIAAAGYVVLERIRNDADSLCEGDNQQVAFELLRVVKLLTMDMDLIASAQKTQTLLDRLDQAKLHCKQAISLARAL